jgi:tetratricopeptide (TPR) repeat protein
LEDILATRNEKERLRLLGAAYARTEKDHTLEAVDLLCASLSGIAEEDCDTYRKLGYLYSFMGLPEPAYHYLKLAIGLDKEDPESWEWLGDAYARNSKFVFAAEAYIRMIGLVEDDDARVLPSKDVGDLLFKASKFEKGAEWYRKCVEPDSVESSDSQKEACGILIEHHRAKGEFIKLREVVDIAETRGYDLDLSDAKDSLSSGV